MIAAERSDSSVHASPTDSAVVTDSPGSSDVFISKVRAPLARNISAKYAYSEEKNSAVGEQTIPNTDARHSTMMTHRTDYSSMCTSKVQIPVLTI